ncbi:MAG: DUF971 domain-containing protein [Ignavibacteria bacterium]|nr:DUF971 domain-containing protein [Ignavibacteria bacterium]
MIQPISIKVLQKEQELFVQWNDSTADSIALGNVRRFCPCAFCTEARINEKEHFIPIYGREQTTIISIQTIGSYALKISWADGHNDGIYEYAVIKAIAAMQFEGAK